MVNSVVPAWLAVLGWAALALWSAVMLHAFEPLAPKAGQAGIVRKAIGLLLALWAALMIVGVAAGGRDVWQPLKAMWPVQGQAGVQPRQAWQSPLSGGGAALSGLLAANGAQGGLSVAPGTHPGFSPVASSAPLDALLAQTRRPVLLAFYADWCVS